jgi:anti-anti-sigma regulatory factor
MKSHGPATIIHLRLLRWHYDPLAASPDEAEEQVETAIDEILQIVDSSEPLLVVSFRDVKEFTGSSLTPIAKLAMAIKQRSGVLMICHVPQEIKAVIAVTRTGELMKVFDTETQAVQSILLAA